MRTLEETQPEFLRAIMGDKAGLDISGGVPTPARITGDTLNGSGGPKSSSSDG